MKCRKCIDRISVLAFFSRPGRVTNDDTCTSAHSITPKPFHLSDRVLPMTLPTRTYPGILAFLMLLVSHPVFSQTDATAEYSVKFTGNWTLTSTPGGVVGGAHFTTIAGGKHNSSVSFWKSGEKATSGLESLAELGSTSGFINEINASSHTDASFTSSVGGGGTGTSTFTLIMKRTYPLVTLGSMIGPSPDWFVGLSNYSLLDGESNWVSSITVNLYPYDAGTEDGDDFSLSNPATSPQGVITSIRGVGKFSNAPMATISFTRQDTPPPAAPTITAIARSANASEYTNADSVTWLITFSEAVQNVSNDDFDVSGTTATVTSVSLVTGSTTQYRVVVSGGNLASLNATISLGLSTTQNITNSSSVGLSSTLPTSSETYAIDNAAPRIATVSPSTADVSPFNATITFNEPIRTSSFRDEDDVTSDNADISSPSGSGLSFQISVTPDNPTQASTITIVIPAGAATDLAGNASIRHEATIEYTPDLTRIPPVVNSVMAINPDGLYHVGEEVEIDVSFSQSVTVKGMPTLMLQFNSGPKAAPYDRGSGSSTLVFSYTLAAGDATVDLDYVDAQALDLGGGTIVGIGGQAADRTLPTPGATGSLSHSSNVRTSGQQDATPSFGDASIEDQVLMMNQRVDAIQLPRATGGDAPLQYDLAPNLPAGLELDATSHLISGTPTTVLDVTTFTWSATDEDGDVTSLAFTIMILPALPLQFPSSATIEDQIFLQNDMIEPIELPAARGGDGELTYSLLPALPTGLQLDLEERQIAGTPTVVLNQTTFTWRVTDEENAMADLTFDMTVLEDFQPTFDTNLTNIDQSFVEGSAIAPISLPSASGGNGELTYELDSNLPEGLVLDTVGFIISGTPTKPASRTQLTWIATDEDGDSATFDVYITVLEDVAPSFAADATISEQVFTSESAIQPVQLPTAISGNDPLRYVLSPDLPTGLELNTTSLKISGTPELATPRTLFTWSVHDVDGDSESISFYLTVIQDEQPIFNQQVEHKVFEERTPIEAFMLPRASGGNGQLEYDLTPELPSGIHLDPDTALISGTPTSAFEATEFSWSATDADGDRAELTFAITVQPRMPLHFPSEAPIQDQVFLQNDPITSVKLPSAMGGFGVLTYSLSPTLPTGLTLDLDARQISGTPTVVLNETKFSWRVTDEDNEFVELSFSITVREDIQPVFDVMLAPIDEDFIQNSAITPFTLPSASSGNGQLVYELATELPDGLVIHATTFEISGIPTLPLNRTLFAWTVTDEDGDSATFNFHITVLKDLAPSFAADASISDQVFTSDSAVDPIRLPTAMGGNGPLNYRLSPDLPNGLALDSSAFEITGTPVAATPKTHFTWSVQDVDGDANSISFYLTVIQDEKPEFSQQVADKTFEERTPIEAFTLPSASGGNGQLDYELTPELPSGIHLDAETASVSGSPTEVFETTEFSWIATDEDGDRAEVTFTIAVQPRIPLHFPSDVSIQDRVFLQNDAISTIELPIATGGFGELTYSLAPDLPSGLVVDLEAHQISGIPTGVLDATEFTWRVTDEDGESETLTFTITVLEDLQPVFDVVLSPIDERFIQHSPITAFTLPKASSGNGQLRYELVSALPAGLVLDDATFEITGIPTVPVNRMLFGWIVTDEDGDSVTFDFHITVLEDVMPSFTAGDSIADQEYISDSAIEPFRLPTATGGNGSLSYSLSPVLPNGLELSPLLYEISGTPTTAQVRTGFTWTATDVDGDAVSLQFYLTVIQDTKPIFTAQVEDKVFVMGMRIVSVTLPEASGGNGSLTYELSPQLPDGLSFDASSASISGTPNTESPTSTYNWSVTDADRDMTTLTFSITVNPASPTVVGGIADVQLFVGGTSQTIDASSVVGGRIDTWSVQLSNSDVVSGSISSSGVLTLAPVFEGQSSVMVTASNVTGSVQLSFSVSVVTDRAEDDQIDRALSLKAGAILSSAMNVFKHRTHSHVASNNAGETSAIRLATETGFEEKLWTGHQESNPNSYEHSLVSGLRPVLETKSGALGNDFVPLNFSHTSTRWRMWGAVDLQNFSSDAPQNEIDGSLSSLYVGGDIAVNENMFTGLAFARHSGSGSYEFSSSAANGAAEIDTTLIGFYPYLQAGDGNRFSMFLVGGIGYGESQIDRRHANGLDQDSDTDMTLFAGGFDYIVLRRSNVDLSIVGDAGVATLTTEADSGILTGRDSASSKSSIGGSVSYTPQIEGGSMVTAVDMRIANGAEGDESGSGFEIGGNLNFIGEHFDFMLDARTTSRSADADVNRTSVSGRLRYKAKNDGSGLTFRISPSWQNSALLGTNGRHERSFRSDGFGPFVPIRGRSIEAEIGYGFWMHESTALLKPRLAWQRLNSSETMLKLGSTWRFNGSSRVTPLIGVDLLRKATDGRGESFGVVAKIDFVL